MNNIKIMTDAACDCPKELIDKYNIDVVGMTLEFEGKEYIYGEKDEKCINTQEFYEQVRTISYLPKTASPSPDRIMQKYKTDEDIIIITLADKLSATYSTAMMAKNMHAEEGFTNKIYVIDSTTGCAGCAQLVKLASELREAGKTAEEIVSIVESKRDDLSCYGMLETVDNAIKGGRINPIFGKMANILNIKVIIKVGDSAVVPIGKARGENKALDETLHKINKEVVNKAEKDVIICHAHALPRAEKAKALLLEEGYKSVYLSEIGPVMGTYTGEGAIIVAVFKS
ncbi:MAG: hypothetical protein ATN31_07945 [Candidatus Epulonipiscioides saccharophilum]|nr:MAG: hypothetical protein ATN31_07945 [Epulopiscium sp. AS2M-Bin001]